MAAKSYWNEVRQCIHERFDLLEESLQKRKALLLSNVDKMEQSYYERIRANEKLVEDLEKMNQALEEATIGNEACDARDFCLRTLKEKTQSSKMPEIEAVKFFENEPLSPTRLNSIGEIVVSCNVTPREAIELPFKPHFIRQHNEGHYYIVSNRGIEITDENLKPIKHTACKHPLMTKISVGDLAISDKHLYISITNQNRVQMYGKEGQFIKEVSKELTGACELRAPTGLCVYKKYLLICEQSNNRVQVLSSHMHSHFIGNNCEGLKEPCSVSVTKDKKVVVLHSGIPSINMYGLDGEVWKQVYLDIPRDSVMTGRLVLGENGDIIVTDANNGVIYLNNDVGSLVYRLGKDVLSTGHSNQYHGTCMNDRGEFMLCDQDNKQIQKFKLDSFSCYV